MKELKTIIVEDNEMFHPLECKIKSINRTITNFITTFVIASIQIAMIVGISYTILWMVKQILGLRG